MTADNLTLKDSFIVHNRQALASGLETGLVYWKLLVCSESSYHRHLWVLFVNVRTMLDFENRGRTIEIFKLGLPGWDLGKQETAILNRRLNIF